MREVRCYECRRKYDYNEDGFCPRCGAFNQPGRESGLRLAELGNDRKDGISEKNHTGSFLHREYHSEEKERREKGLDKGADRSDTFRRLGTDGTIKAVRKAGKKENSLGTILFAALIYIFILLFNLAS